MTIAKRLSEYLANAGIEYEVVNHPFTVSASRTAQAAHITGDRVAKTLVLHDDQGYLLAVVPSTHRVELDAIGPKLGRRLNLATEKEIADLFDDCELGAIPPVGAAYGLKVMLDESLTDQEDVYFEGGDHRNLVHVNSAAFAKAMEGAERGRFSHHV